MENSSSIIKSIPMIVLIFVTKSNLQYCHPSITLLKQL